MWSIFCTFFSVFINLTKSKDREINLQLNYFSNIILFNFDFHDVSAIYFILWKKYLLETLFWFEVVVELTFNKVHFKILFWKFRRFYRLLGSMIRWSIHISISGNSAALYEAIHKKIFVLPDDFEIYPGHDYKVNLWCLVEFVFHQNFGDLSHILFILLYNSIMVEVIHLQEFLKYFLGNSYVYSWRREEI